MMARNRGVPEEALIGPIMSVEPSPSKGWLGCVDRRANPTAVYHIAHPMAAPTVRERLPLCFLLGIGGARNFGTRVACAATVRAFISVGR